MKKNNLKNCSDMKERKRKKLSMNVKDSEIKYPISGDFKMPEISYNEIIEDLNNCIQSTRLRKLNKLGKIIKFCYTRKKTGFDFRNTKVHSFHALIRSAEMALNNRDFRTLYEIINRSLSLQHNYGFLWQQMRHVSQQFYSSTHNEDISIYL